MTIDALERSLAGRTRGPVIAPDHRLYDSARAVFNGMLDRRPRLIFRPADMDDLVAAVRWASESESAAFGGRRAVANVTALSIWGEPAGDEAGMEWGRRAAGLFEPYSLSGGGYLNYPEVDQTAARVAAAFGPERFAKLRSIKRTWDPDNRFRHNANIVPA